MALSKNMSKLDNNSNRYYFDVLSNNHDCFITAHTTIVNITQYIHGIINIVLMTKLDNFGTTE